MKFLWLFGVLCMGTIQAKEVKIPLSKEGQVYHLPNFLNEKECDHLIALGEPKLKRSTVVSETSVDGRLDEGRTSRGMFLNGRGMDKLVDRIERRIAKLTKTPVENGESIQILHYDIGAEYQPHFDTFDPDSVGGKDSLARGGQRVATVVMYLNSTEEGGETIFPNLNLAVKAKRGDAVLFYHLKEDGSVDPNAFHGGAPVKKGEKWIATKWIRLGEFK